MKFNFRKIASVFASAVMLSSTVGFAAAASYPAPFVSSGTEDSAVVVGGSADASDWAAAVKIQENLNTFITTSSTTTTTSSTGGDSINLATSSRKIYYGDNLNTARGALNDGDLPSILADGTFNDLSGTAYDYTQTITLGPADIVFGTSGSSIDDPTLYIDSTITAGELYNYTLSFSKNVNVSDATNVQGQKISILGVDYVIGASSTNTTLYLYGSGETLVIGAAEENTVNIAGIEHTVELVTTAGATAGTIKIDGVSKSVVEGSNYGFAGDINVYIKDIIHPAFAGDLRQAELIMGANTLKLVNGQTVKIGADATSLRGTQAVINGAAGNEISGFTIQMAMAKSQLDHIASGESFTDPVFGGIKVEFAGVVPEFDSDARGKIIVDTDNTQFAYVEFEHAGATEGAQRIAYTYDSSQASTTVKPILAHTSNTTSGYIHVLEGENARVNDWIVINNGDEGTIVEVLNIDVSDDATSGTIQLSDVLNPSVPDKTITLINTSGVFTKTDLTLFGGTGYTIKVVNATASDQINITWSTAGTRTLFPRIKLKDGGWMALLGETAVTNGSTVILPDGLTSLAITGDIVSNASSITSSLSNNGIDWFYNNGTTSGSLTFQSLTTTAIDCNFNATLGPAILFIEPKKWDDGSYGDHICIPLTTTGTTKIAIDDPVFNGTNSGFLTLTSDTYQKEAIDKYGTFLIKEDRTNENGKVTLTYPDSQMYADILFADESAVIVPGSTGGGGGRVTIVSDSDVANVAGKNLVVIGGSCINTVAAELLGSPSPLCGADFTEATGVGAGGYVIEVFTSPYADGDSGQVAMLVAGYEAAQTASAVDDVVDGFDDSEVVGTKVTSPVVTSG